MQDGLMEDAQSHELSHDDDDDESDFTFACDDLLDALTEIVSSGEMVLLSGSLSPAVDRAVAAVERLGVDEWANTDDYAIVGNALDEVEHLLENSGPSLGGWAQPLQSAREHLARLQEADHGERS